MMVHSSIERSAKLAEPVGITMIRTYIKPDTVKIDNLGEVVECFCPDLLHLGVEPVCYNLLAKTHR